MANPNAIKGKGFDARPENINRTGANRKLVSTVNEELAAMGVTSCTKPQITECYLKLLNLTITELEQAVKNNDNPALIRIVGKAILSGRGFEVIEKVLDRSIGKPDQKTDLTTGGEKLSIELVRREN